MLRRAIPTRCLPNLSCVRNLRAKPDYFNPADEDPVEMRKFDEEFGIREQKEDIWESKNEWFAKYFDPYVKFRARLGKFFGASMYYRQSPEEIAERAELTARLHEFYQHIPQQYPDAGWWNDVIDHYVRYNDYEGAERLYAWLKEYEIDVDQIVLDKFQRFFYENDPVGLMTRSVPQRLREQSEYIPERPDDNAFRVGEYGIEAE